MQVENFGSEIVVTIAPTNAAARHAPASQMNTVEPPRVNVDLHHRLRRRHVLHFRAFHFDRENWPFRFLIDVGARRRRDQVAERSQHFIVEEAAHVIERLFELVVGGADPFGAVA